MLLGMQQPGASGFWPVQQNAQDKTLPLHPRQPHHVPQFLWKRWLHWFVAVELQRKRGDKNQQCVAVKIFCIQELNRFLNYFLRNARIP